MTTAGKPIPNADYLAECFVYVAGNLIWKHRPISHFSNARTAAMWNAKNAEKRAGRLMLVGGYTQIGLDGRRFLAHRLIASMHGIDTSGVVDHINGNPMDNRAENLRGCSQQQNAMNNSGWKKKALPLGVSRVRSGDYVAHIQANGQQKYLGRFETEAAANQARKAAELLYYPGFSRAQSEAADRGVEIDEVTV